MPTKPKTENKEITPALITETLKKAGYKIDRYRNQKAEMTVFVTPADLTTKDGQFVATDALAEIGVQSECRVFAQCPQNLLIIRVNLPKTKNPAKK